MQNFKQVFFICFPVPEKRSIFAKVQRRMNRIKEEQRVVGQMIRLYCRKKEGNKELCPSCKELLQYATARLEHCKFGENKPTCKKCPIHCYSPQMRERIRKVMRWAGPRMIWYHPVAAIKHIIRG